MQFILKVTFLSIDNIAKFDLHDDGFFSNRRIVDHHNLGDLAFAHGGQVGAAHGLDDNFEVLHDGRLQSQLLNVGTGLVVEVGGYAGTAWRLLPPLHPQLQVGRLVGLELEGGELLLGGGRLLLGEGDAGSLAFRGGWRSQEEIESDR